MNLAEQIRACGAAPKVQVVDQVLEIKKANLLKGHTKMAAKAKERYKIALKDWTKTASLENRLGYASTVCNATLRRYLAEGLVERRPAGGEIYCKRKGYEWRWKNGT